MAQVLTGTNAASQGGLLSPYCQQWRIIAVVGGRADCGAGGPSMCAGWPLQTDVRLWERVGMCMKQPYPFIYSNVNT